MASRMVLLGIVPVWTHTPPIVALRSISATRLPILAAEMAAFCPAGPLPITTRSYLSFCMCARRKLSHKSERVPLGRGRVSYDTPAPCRHEDRSAKALSPQRHRGQREYFRYCHDEAAKAAEASAFSPCGTKSRSLVGWRPLVMTEDRK